MNQSTMTILEVQNLIIDILYEGVGDDQEKAYKRTRGLLYIE